VFVVMLAALLAGLVVLILWLSSQLANSDDTEDDGDPAVTATVVSVPSLVNLSQEDARRELTAVGLVADFTTEEAEGFEANTVIRQNPAPETEVEQDSVVQVVLAAAAERVRVPDLAGRDAREAEDLLVAEGLTVDKVREASDIYDEGVVIETQPGANTEVNAGSQVVLVISTGRDQEDVPDVLNVTRSQATALMSAAGFDVVEFITESSGQVAADLVIRTEPPIGQRTSLDTTIRVYVSSGPAEVQVPPVVSLTLQAAREQLEGDLLQLVVEVVEQPVTDPNQVGVVLAINPPAGSLIRQGQTVQLSVGVLDETPPTTETTTTVPETTTEVTPPPDDGGGDGGDGGDGGGGNP
jgi:serine/threonine-protein kinase